MNTQALVFITHPEVSIDPSIPIPDWPLSKTGRIRMRRFASDPILASVSLICCSAEQKAKEAAEIIARERSCRISIVPELGEVDRSAQGYVPPERHAEIVREFFAHPDVSVAGRETALKAQRRISDAIENIRQQDIVEGDVAIVSHGAVGCLLMAKLRAAPISLDFAQPASGGGSFFRIDKGSGRVLGGWHTFEDAHLSR